jgi:uncharacterized protein YerC
MSNTSLTPDQVLEVRAMIKAGATVKSIERRYGISRKTIQRIKTGETYKNVKPVGSDSVFNLDDESKKWDIL